MHEPFEDWEPSTQGDPAVPKVLRSGKFLNGHYCPVVIRSYSRGKHGEPLVIWHIGLGFDSPPPLILPGKLVYNNIWEAERILSEYVLDWALNSGMDVEKLCAPSDPDQSGKSILAAAFQVSGGRADDSDLPEKVSPLHRGGAVRSKRNRPRRTVYVDPPAVQRPGPLPLPKLRSIPLPGTVPTLPKAAAPADESSDT